MKNILLTAAAIMFAATIGSAQTAAFESDLNQQQQTSAVNHNTFEGSTAINNTPGVGGGAGNSTAQCVVANGFGISGPGIGISHSNGTVNSECITRIEASILRDIASMPAGLQRTAVITHFCTNDETMRNTLVSIGLCGVKEPARRIMRQPFQGHAPLYLFCGKRDDGVFAVQLAPNSALPVDAAAACTADYAANGGVNIGTLQ